MNQDNNHINSTKYNNKTFYSLVFFYLINLLGIGFLSLYSWQFYTLSEIKAGGQKSDAIIKSIAKPKSIKKLFNLSQISLSKSYYAGYVYSVDNKLYYGSFFADDRKLSRGEQIEIFYLPQNPQLSIAASVDYEWRWQLPLAVLMVLFALAIYTGNLLWHRDPKIPWVQYSAIILVISLAATIFFVIDHNEFYNKITAVKDAAIYSGEWGSLTEKDNNFTLRTSVLHRYDDSTAFAQRKTNEVNFSGLAFGPHSYGLQDMIFLRFLLEVPKNAKIQEAHLEMHCYSNAHQAGKASETFRIERIPGEVDFRRDHFRDYQELVSLPVLSQPIKWQCQPWDKGHNYVTANIAPLIQEWVNDNSYHPGKYIGLRIAPFYSIPQAGLKHLRYAGAREQRRPVVLYIKYNK